MINDNRNEIIESLRTQNEYWAEESYKLEDELLINRIFLTALSLYSIFVTGWLMIALLH
jgi:hypothetical protein